MPRLNELESRPFRLPNALGELYAVKRSVMVGFTVPPAIAERIEDIAKKQGITKSEWCARIVSAALDDRVLRPKYKDGK